EGPHAPPRRGSLPPEGVEPALGRPGSSLVGPHAPPLSRSQPSNDVYSLHQAVTVRLTTRSSPSTMSANSSSSRSLTCLIFRASRGVAAGLSTTKSASQPGCRLPITPPSPSAWAAPAVCCHQR